MCPTDFQKLIADEGYVVAPNFAKKRKALAKTARRGDVAAQVSLGVMCYHGIGVPQNLPEAATWFQMAADRGDCEAQGTMISRSKWRPLKRSSTFSITHCPRARFAPPW